MKSQLFIPQTIKVGFQNRSDTFTKKLAYIIYTDNKGVLRKETSWQGWRDKNIEPQDFDNKPFDGFILNKNVERCKWNHFGSNRTVIRVYDSRGFEFEITPENLIGILMQTDCNKRALQGEFVYAWAGKELVLLPTNSEEYQNSVEFSKLQGERLAKKDVIEGCSYLDKRQQEWVYMGSQKIHTIKCDNHSSDKRTLSYKKMDHKEFVFSDLKNPKNFKTSKTFDFLAKRLSDSPVLNFGNYVKEWNKRKCSSRIVGVDIENINLSGVKDGYIDILSIKGDDVYWEQIQKYTRDNQTSYVNYGHYSHKCSLKNLQDWCEDRVSELIINDIRTFGGALRLMNIEDTYNGHAVRILLKLENGSTVPLKRLDMGGLY